MSIGVCLLYGSSSILDLFYSGATNSPSSAPVLWALNVWVGLQFMLYSLRFCLIWVVSRGGDLHVFDWEGDGSLAEVYEKTHNKMLGEQDDVNLTPIVEQMTIEPSRLRRPTLLFLMLGGLGLYLAIRTEGTVDAAATSYLLMLMVANLITWLIVRKNEANEANTSLAP